MRLIDRIGGLFGRKAKAAEGAYRPGPYRLDDGWLSASAGKLLNWWQAGHSLQYGESGAMVEACIGAYSQTVAMCPPAHKKSTGDGGTEVVVNSAAARFFKRPNDYETISDFLLNLADRLYRDGEAFGYAVRNDRNEIIEIHRMRKGYPYVGTDGSVFYSLSGNEIAESRFDLSAPVPARDVLHVRLKTPRHPLKGVSPILAVELDRALSGAALNQQIAFYLNQAKPSFMLETDQQLTAEQTQALRARWDEQTKGDGAGGTPILTWGLKAHAVSASAKDSEIADMLKLSDQNIALAFRMPLQILGIGGTPFASTEALMSAWKSTGLGFALNHIEEAFGQLFRLKGYPDEFIELDADALLRSSFKELMESLNAAAGTLLTYNEARAKIGQPRKPGGDDLYVQMQDIPLEMAAKVQQQALEKPKPAEPTAPADDEPEEVDESEKMLAIVDDRVSAAIAALPVPVDGRDADPEKIAEMVAAAVAAAVPSADAIQAVVAELTDDEKGEAARAYLYAAFSEIETLKMLPRPPHETYGAVVASVLNNAAKQRYDRDEMAQLLKEMHDDGVTS